MLRTGLVAVVLLAQSQAPARIIDQPDVAGTAAHGWRGWVTYGPVRSYYATLRVPLGEPAGPGQGTFGWIGVQTQGTAVTDFTQIGFYWAPGANYSPPDGYSSFPVGQPILFAWTTYDGNTEIGSTWRLGPQLFPGQVLAVRIVALAPASFQDQYRTSHGWVTLANATFRGPLAWTAEAESYGPPTPVTFLSRSWAPASGRLYPLARGTVTAP